MENLLKYYCMFLLSLIVAGCASHPDKLQAESVSTLAYENYTCATISSESTRIDSRLAELHEKLKKERQGDIAQTAVAVTLFWPALFFLDGDNTPEATEFRRLKGEYEALGKISEMKNCGIEFKTIGKS